MNDVETKTPVELPESDPLQAQISGLQKQVNVLTLALLLVSITLCAYLGLMVRRAKADLAAFKPVATQSIQVFAREKPRMEALLRGVLEYSKVDPAFAPIIAKYKIAVTSNAPAGAIPMSPAPAPTAPK